MQKSLSYLKKSQVAYLVIQEMKLNTNHSECVSRVSKTLHKFHPGAKAYPVSNKTFRMDTLHQPGGVMSVVNRPFESSSTYTLADPIALVQ